MKKCTISGCENVQKAKELCGMHYQRWLRKGDPLADQNSQNICKVEGCFIEVHSKGLCLKHFE